ncbi:hypothetical protein ON064_00515 [Planococcus sp. A6]|uniref:hypothetical protein n=1 Tax=Planococcus sp. A6 TaxID=2992760 RepID=UPI00237A6044|nr:hypothetical protein [Planococcus sp. A6]MDE0581531.1 hypothetical protein [Planococcus sp. A6]
MWILYEAYLNLKLKRRWKKFQKLLNKNFFVTEEGVQVVNKEDLPKGTHWRTTLPVRKEAAHFRESVHITIPDLGDDQPNGHPYQVTLVDHRNREQHPLHHPRLNRFFYEEAKRNEFVTAFEKSVMDAGGRFIKKPHLQHPLFSSFNILSAEGDTHFSLTVYH